MTVLEVQNKLFDWFSKNDCLSLKADIKDLSRKDDFKNIYPITLNEEMDRALLKCALAEYEKHELIKMTTGIGMVYYFLCKPFSSYPQTVTVEPDTAVSISNFINKFCDEQSEKSDYCDAAKITSKDIRNILYLAVHFASKCDKKDE